MSDMCPTCGQLTEPCECGRPKHLGAGHACTFTPDRLSLLPWRTGRKIGRNIYAQLGAEPSDDDLYIGVMFVSDEVAAEACEAHNYRLALRMNASAIHPVT